MQFDIRKINEQFVKNHSFDRIYHLAAQTSVQKSLQDPELDFQINLYGTFKLLNLAREYNSEIIVIGSAASVGETYEFPISAETKQNPISPYGASKAGAEIYTRVFYKSFGIRSVVVRPFNVYSPIISNDDPYAGVISTFIDNAVKGEPLIIYGDGNQTRDFVYVEDVAKILVEIPKRDGIWGETIQIGTGNETSINYLAELVKGLLKSNSQIKHYEKRHGEIVRSVADISLLQKYDLPEPLPIEAGLHKLLKKMNNH